MVYAQAGHQHGIIPPIAEEDACSFSCSMIDRGLAEQMAQDSREGLDVEKVRDRPKGSLEEDGLRLAVDAEAIEEGNARLLEKGEDVHSCVYR